MTDDPEREQRAAVLANQRRDDLEQAAEARGRAAERITARLERMDDEIERHKVRLDAINGSVKATGSQLDRLSDQIESIANDLATRDKVNAALVDAAAKAAKNAADVAKYSGAKKLTRWQTVGIWIGSFVGVSTLVLLFIQTVFK